MRKGLTLIELMVLIAVIAAIAAIAIPSLMANRRASNERHASAALKSLTTAQDDFRKNDRDGNGVNDFWTADVFALYGLIPIPPGQTTLPTDATAARIIKLIEPSIAAADGACQAGPAGGSGAYAHVDIAWSIREGSDNSGYVFRAFGAKDSGGGATTLMNDTDGPGRFYGNCHDRNRFAILTAPIHMAAGRLMFIIDEDFTELKYNLPSGYGMKFIPISGNGSSSSATPAGGISAATATLDLPGPANPFQPVFPASPGSLGFSKFD